MRPISKRVSTIPGSATIGSADKASQLIAAGYDVIDLSAARASDPTPAHIVTAARDALQSAFPMSPGQGTVELRNAAAVFLKDHYGVDADPATEIMASFGFKQSVGLTIPTLMEPGESVLVEDPCFVSYHPLINVWGNPTISVPLLEKNRFRWTEEQLENAVRPDTRAILLCSPQNPTGAVHTESDLEIIAKVAKRHDLWVITDDIYQWTTWGGRKYISMCSMPGMRERTITMVPLSKGFVMNAWRAGFIFGPPEVIKVLTKLMTHTINSVPRPIQAGAIAALTTPQPQFMIDLWKDWEDRCRFFSAALDAMPGIHCPTPEGGYFAWANITETGLSSDEFAQKLLEEQQVVVLAGTKFGPAGEGYIRVSMVRERKDLERAVSRVHAFAESCMAKKK